MIDLFYTHKNGRSGDKSYLGVICDMLLVSFYFWLTISQALYVVFYEWPIILYSAQYDNALHLFDEIRLLRLDNLIDLIAKNSALAEALAIREGLNFAISIQCYRLLVQSDCQSRPLLPRNVGS